MNTDTQDNHPSGDNKLYDNSAKQRKRLALILKTGKIRLWFYYVPTRHFFWLSDEGSLEEEYNPSEFARFFNLADFGKMRDLMYDIYDGKRETVKAELRSVPQADGQCNYYETSISVTSRTADSRPLALLGVQHDVTEVVRSQQRASRMLLRYRTIFDSSQLDMLFYDKNGVLTDINDRACASFNVQDRNCVLDGSFKLQNNPMYNQIPLDELENTRTTTIVDFADFADEKYHLDECKLKGRMYYDSAINPIRNERGELEGVYMSGRDITESVESFHRLQEGSRQLLQTTQSMQEYVDNVNYALRVNNVRFLSYDPEAYLLEVSDNVTHSQLGLTQLRCIRLAAPRFRRTVNGLLHRMDRRNLRSIEQAIEIVLHDSQHRPIWLLINMVPIIDADGGVERYFGMCRTITEIVATERQLAIESEKAKDANQLMQAFLTNMSNEIRTPLKCVVNNASKFSTPHDEADEPAFVEEIKRNTNSLLLLVNDVLFLSRLDANMQEYKRIRIDFVEAFDNLCQMGMKSKRPEVSLMVIDPYNTMLVDIDLDHLRMIVLRLCNFACLLTHEGTITTSYEYRHGELTIKIEDTGVGLDEQIKAHLFERFARDEQGAMLGTGLDMPIVKMLAEQMGGTVEVQSELGVGTTSWVSLPCEAIEMERKRESMIS